MYEERCCCEDSKGSSLSRTVVRSGARERCLRLVVERREATVERVWRDCQHVDHTHSVAAASLR